MKNHKSQKWENRGQNERRHLSPRWVPEHCKQPQSWETLSGCCSGLLSLSQPLAVSCWGCWHWVVGPKSGGGTGSICFCFHKVFVGFFLSYATWIQVFACWLSFTTRFLHPFLGLYDLSDTVSSAPAKTLFNTLTLLWVNSDIRGKKKKKKSLTVNRAL